MLTARYDADESTHLYPSMESTLVKIAAARSDTSMMGTRPLAAQAPAASTEQGLVPSDSIGGRTALSSLILDGFLAPYRGRTLDNYMVYLRRWTAWCGTRIDPADPRRSDIESWIGDMREEGLTDNTIRSYLTGLSGFTSWLVAEGHLDRDPMTHVRRPVAPRAGSRAWLSPTELHTFIDAVQANPDPAVRAGLLIPALCATRPAETLGLNVPDIGERTDAGEHGTVTRVTLTLRGRKGGGATDTLTVPDVVGQAVRDAAGNRSRGPLLISAATGLRMSQDTLRKHMRRTLQHAGIRRPGLTPYSLRHSGITIALEAGVPDRDVAAWVGHSSTAQMRVYDHLRKVAGGNVANAIYDAISLTPPSLVNDGLQLTSAAVGSVSHR